MSADCNLPHADSNGKDKVFLGKMKKRIGKYGYFSKKTKNFDYLCALKTLV